MFDDILGPYEEDEKQKEKKPQVDLNGVCYDCGNTFEECECEEGFNLGDLDDDVEFVSYKIDHPTHANPIFYIKVKAPKTPTEALIEASDKLSGLCNEALTKFQEALSS